MVDNKITQSDGLRITNDQLSKVKLKKVSFKKEIGKVTPAKGRQLVTLKELQSVKLKKTCEEAQNFEENQVADCRTPFRDLSNFKFGIFDNENKILSSKFS